jgi:hypothetical protein
VFRATLIALSLLATPANARQEDLWSLFLYEQTADVRGVHLTEEAEDALDEAQRRARIQMSLSHREAAELYRRAREVVRGSKAELCADPLITSSTSPIAGLE